jgi:hypothetical protein
MKNLKLVLALLLIFFWSCSKNGLIEDYSWNDHVLKNAAASGSVFEVYPGANATQALIEAFDNAKIAGKGAVVKLMAGNYELGSIEVREFFGTFMGAGSALTIITNKADIATQNERNAAIIKFIGGEVTVSDMAVKFSPLNNAAELFAFLFTDHSDDFVPAKSYVKADVRNVSITGLFGPDKYPAKNSDFTFYNGIDLCPYVPESQQDITRSNIDANINGCSFLDLGKGMKVNGLKSGLLNIGTDKGNIFQKYLTGILFNENTGISAKMANNDLAYYYSYDTQIAIDISSGKGRSFENISGGLGKYEIRYNKFYGGELCMICVSDIWRSCNPDNPAWMNISIDHNTFTGEYMSVALASYAMKNALFSNNTFKGEDVSIYTYGLSLAPDDPLYEYSLGEGNKYLNHNIEFEYDIFWMYFATDTESNLVVGNTYRIKLWDYGTNNKFNGTKAEKNQPHPPYMQQKSEELRKLVKGRM